MSVHYRGTLENGAEFDSSYKRGEPATFPLSRVIPCWTQGVQKLHVGEKARLVCPASTAETTGFGPLAPSVQEKLADAAQVKQYIAVHTGL